MNLTDKKSHAVVTASRVAKEKILDMTNDYNKIVDEREEWEKQLEREVENKRQKIELDMKVNLTNNILANKLAFKGNKQN